MKKMHIGLSLTLIILFFNGIAQDYNMSSSTITTCSGNFYDSGGAVGDYGADEEDTMTFYPETLGSVLKFTFTGFETESHPQCQWDYLTIFDGESALPANFYGQYCGTNSPGEVIATSASGALTFVFSSNKKYNYPGWAASIECVAAGASFSGIWTGSVSKDWSLESNWDDGHVPGLLTDVIIASYPTGGNFPEINTGSGAICNDLTIQSGGHLYVPSNNSLSVFGEIYNNSGEAGLVVKSDNSGTGSLIHQTANVEATAERYLTSLRWHFIGMPVENEVAGLFDLPAGHSDIYLRTHNEADNSWGDYIVPIETPLELGKGYITWVGNSGGINQDEKVEFKGALNAGDYTTGQSGFFDLEYTAGHGLNLICNPFPSALQADIQNWDQANNKIAQSVWVWDPNLGNYRYWNGNNGFNNNGYGTLTDGIIPPMQAFFIQTTGINAWLTIPQNSRVHSTQSFYKTSGVSENVFSLRVDGNESSDQIFVSFFEEATEDFDDTYDVQKIFGASNAPQLYTIGPDLNFSINALPKLQDIEIVELGFICSVDNEFTINAVDIQLFNDNIEVILEDTKEGFFQNLKNKPDYSFFNEMGDEPNRFKLHFANILNVNSMISENINVYAYSNFVYVKFPKDQIHAEIQVFNLIGQQITSVSVHNENNEIKINSNPGYYIVKIITSNEIITKKVFIK